MCYLPERVGRRTWQFGNWDLAPHLGLSDECTVHPQQARFENFFFMHEIVQIASDRTISVRHSWFMARVPERDERKEVESRVSEA